MLREKYNAEKRKINFKTNQFSKYVLGYNEIVFKDVIQSSWYSNAVEYISARGITTGTGNGYFNPEGKLARGQFIVMMMRAYGIKPASSNENNFADAGNTYYTNYLAAAKEMGISNGVGNNKFDPEKVITRQEMFTLLYNALKALGELPENKQGNKLSNYHDSNEVAIWAKDAMKLFVEANIVKGSEGKINPQNTSTRAQMAQIIYNLLII